MTEASESVLEKVARAIYDGRNGRGARAWASLPRSHQSPYFSDARAAIAASGLAMLVERAFRDGLAFATNVVVHDPDEAWRTSRIRASLHEGEAQR